VPEENSEASSSSQPLMLILGVEGDTVERVHNSHRPLRIGDNVYPPGTVLRFREWGEVPTAFLRCGTPDLRVQAHRDGIVIRTRLGAQNWVVATGHKIAHDSENGTSYVNFSIRHKGYGAGQLVCAAFYDLTSPPYTYALHATRRTEGLRPDDSAQNLSWGSASENMFDKARDGKANNCADGKRVAILCRPLDAPLQASEGTLDSRSVPLDTVDADGTTWIRFDSRIRASRELKINAYAIGNTMCGKRRHTHGWTFRWDSVPRPESADMRFVDLVFKKKERRFVTRDGRLLIEKTDLRGLVFVEQHLTPSNLDGYTTICTTSLIPDIAGMTKLHRVVARLFLEDEISKKTLETGLSFSELSVDHINGIAAGNGVANLRVLTIGENVTAAVGKVVVETDENGNELGRWTSVSAAAREIGVSYATMNKYTRCKRPFERANGDSDPTTKRFFKFLDDKTVQK